MNRTWDVALDADGDLYVANRGTAKLPGNVTVYAAGARGNASPLRTIGGSNANMSEPAGVAVDSFGNLYVSNWGNNTITIYAPGANGDVAPINTIGGSNTGLGYPSGLVVSNGMIYVANPYNSTVTVYASGVTGNAAPVQEIEGSDTGLMGPEQVAVDSYGDIYAANYECECTGASVTEYAPGATGDAAPIATIGGKNTDLGSPWGVALDASGNVYVSNFHAYQEGDEYDWITVYGAGANGDVAPIAKYQWGPHGNIRSGPTGIAIQ